MLRIRAYHDGAPAKAMDLSTAYLVGNDRVALRADMKFSGGEIVFDTRSRGAAALSILWPVEGVGNIMLETPRLQERKAPYNLNVELARGQLMRIAQKREDWGLYDFPEGAPIYKEIDAARQLLVEALTAADEVSAARHADGCIIASVKAGEAVTALHAEVFLKRRHEADQLAKRPLGCRIYPNQVNEDCIQRLTELFDFALLPFQWSALEPTEGAHKPAGVDALVKALAQHRFPCWGSALLSFDPGHLPAWTQKLGKDYEKFRDHATRHIRQTLKTFGPHVQVWEVISAAHAFNPLGFTFEQIMDLTRIASLLVKQMSPKCQSVVGIVLPWGEYYAKDSRTIPPSLYAEMAVQSGINFDAFGLDIRFGTGESGGAARDLMQISSLLDRYGALGKPIHVTAAGVPSTNGAATDGHWHGAWSPDVQASWMREFYQIALSKPFVETVTCARLIDGSEANGVLDVDCKPKPAYQEILGLKRQITGG
ncbi:MAG TPA: hypothetical protein VNT79_06515 [Phycisphaerae bacterium]|nr:hypothetical protein [Phycisphaerae bacterium]